MVNLEDKKLSKNKVYLFDYDAENLEERAVSDINECIPYKATKTVTWIDIDQVPPISFLNELQ